MAKGFADGDCPNEALGVVVDAPMFKLLKLNDPPSALPCEAPNPKAGLENPVLGILAAAAEKLNEDVGVCGKPVLVVAAPPKIDPPEPNVEVVELVEPKILPAVVTGVPNTGAAPKTEGVLSKALVCPPKGPELVFTGSPKTLDFGVLNKEAVVVGCPKIEVVVVPKPGTEPKIGVDVVVGSVPNKGLVVGGTPKVDADEVVVVVAAGVFVNCVCKEDVDTTTPNNDVVVVVTAALPPKIVEPDVTGGIVLIPNKLEVGAVVVAATLVVPNTDGADVVVTAAVLPIKLETGGVVVITVLPNIIGVDEAIVATLFPKMFTVDVVVEFTLLSLTLGADATVVLFSKMFELAVPKIDLGVEAFPNTELTVVVIVVAPKSKVPVVVTLAEPVVEVLIKPPNTDVDDVVVVVGVINSDSDLLVFVESASAYVDSVAVPEVVTGLKTEFEAVVVFSDENAGLEVLPKMVA